MRAVQISFLFAMHAAGCTSFVANDHEPAAGIVAHDAVATYTPEPVASAEARKLEGAYIFEKVGGENACILKLDAAPTITPNFYVAWLSGDCVGNFSFLSALTGWEPIGSTGVRLLGAEGYILGDFIAVKGGALEARNVYGGSTFTLRMPGMN